MRETIGVKSKKQNGRIRSLDGARFAAAMIIVFSHFEFLKDYGRIGNIYWQYLHNPTMGVDFFFMLSGFGMMFSSMKTDTANSSSMNRVQESISFATGHVKKIYPLYVAFLLLGIPFTILINYFEYGVALLRGMIKSILFLGLDITLLQSVTGKILYSYSLNGVCWFLSCLFCIYLVSPLIIRYLIRYIKTVKAAIKGIFLCIICSVVFAIIFLYIEGRTSFDDLCYGSPFRRVFYVIMGMLLAKIFALYNGGNNKNGVLDNHFFRGGGFENLVMGGSVVWFFVRNTSSYFLGPFIYIIDMVVVGCDILALAIGKGFFSWLYSRKQLVYLGDLSMYIFLTHYNIRMYTDFIVRMLKIESFQVRIVEVIIILLLTFLISVSLHRGVLSKVTKKDR